VHTNAADFLLAGKRPDATALLTLDRTYTYGEVQFAAAAVTARLRRLGVSKSDRMILAGENSLFWVAAYLGCLKAGLVCVPLPETISAEDFRYVLSTTGPCITFASAAFAVRHRGDLRDSPVIIDHGAASVAEKPAWSTFDEILADFVAYEEPARGCGDDLAALMFTSGSTGKPRGVMVSHTNIIANTESIVEYLALTGGDRVMTVLPFHYCFGTSLLHTHLKAGGSLVLDSRFMYPEIVLQRMIATECTGFAGVPSHFQILLRRSSLREKEFPRLRYVQQAGGHLAPAAVRELQDALPGTQVFVMYGQTEATARLSYLPPELLDRKRGSIGKGIPGVRLRVLDEFGRPVKPGEVGEIVAEGDNITLGYWRAPDETATTFRNGALCTGDLATVDEDGYIYVAGRAKDFLKCAGKRVSCRQLEEQIVGCDAVMEAAVVAVPDEILGDAVMLFVVPRSASGTGIEAAVRSFCKERLPLSQMPKRIVVMDALPKNSAGKVLKEKLKRRSVESTLPVASAAQSQSSSDAISSPLYENC
jgi:long-chain acyl-CoA synthetase